MIVNVFVDIESCKDIKRVAKVEISWNGCVILEDREEVHAADYRINVDHGHDPISATVEIRFYNPHPIVGVQFSK